MYKRNICIMICFLIIVQWVHSQAIFFPGINGNHYIDGYLDVKQATRIMTGFPAKPTWIVGYEENNRSIWYVLLEDSSVYYVEVGKKGITQKKTNRPVLSKENNAFTCQAAWNE